MNRILIADDNEDIVNILKKFAEKENLDADVAFDGQQALDMLDKNNSDLILLDIMMPKQDGY